MGQTESKKHTVLKKQNGHLFSSGLMTHCAEKAEWTFIFQWSYDFLFFILFLIIFHVLN